MFWLSLIFGWKGENAFTLNVT